MMYRIKRTSAWLHIGWITLVSVLLLVMLLLSNAGANGVRAGRAAAQFTITGFSDIGKTLWARTVIAGATRTPTPVIVSIDITDITQNTDRTEFILTLHLQNTDRATGYFVRIFEKSTNRQINEVYYRAAPPEQVRISSVGVPNGTYLIVVELRVPGLDTQPSSSIPIAYNAPAPASATAVPNAAAPVYTMDSPLIPILIGVLTFSVLALLGVIVLLVLTNRRTAAVAFSPAPAHGYGAAAGSQGSQGKQNVSPIPFTPVPPQVTPANAAFDPERTRIDAYTPTLSIPAKLRLLDPAPPFLGLPPEVSISHQPFVIGRASKSSTPDLDLKADGVSRTHSIISLQEGRFYVADQQSRNGTFVNGERLQEGELRELRSSDRVRFDKHIEYEFLVTYPAPRDPDETNEHRIPSPRDTAQLDPHVEAEASMRESQRRRPRLPANLVATLEVLDAPNEDVGKVYALQFVETRVGSAKEATNDVQLSGRGISRGHIRLICEISEGRPVFYIVDDNSTNGTRLTRRNDINERPLVPRRREALQEGEEYVILLGERTRLSFYYRMDAAQNSASSAATSAKSNSATAANTADSHEHDHEGEEA